MMTWKPYIAGLFLVLAFYQAPLKAEDDPSSAIRGLSTGGAADPSGHLGGGTGYGRGVAPGYGGGNLSNYISQCMAGRPGSGSLLGPSVAGAGAAGGNIFTQSCGKCHAVPSAQASINAINNGVNVKGVITKMPPGNPALGQQVLQFLQSQGAQ